LGVIASGESQEVEFKESFHSFQEFSKLMCGLYTSTSAVSEYGIHIIPPTTTLYVTEQKNQIIKSAKNNYTSLEDTIIFTLLHDNRDSQTYAKYMILLHKDKINIRNLKQKAQKYNIHNKLESILYDLKPVLQ
jgi:ABC-type hemin transport system ATPase subunit